MTGPMNPAEQAAGWKALAKRGSDASGIEIEGEETAQLSESSLDKVVRLTQVVVPRHTRVNPKSGKTEDVDTYTYNRKSAIGHGINARAGTFRGGLPPVTDTHSRDMEYRNGSRKSPIRQAVENGKDLGDRIVKAPAKGRRDGAGTVDDPIDVHGDLDRAVQLLSQGKHIRLNKPDEVSILADKMNAFVAEVKAKGEKTPNMNLCQVTIPGTNLFCHENKGIPRIKMPQLGGEPRPGSPAYAKRDARGRADITEEFKQSLRDRGIKMTEKRVPASRLKATQNELDGAKVAGMAGAMKAGKVKEGSIFVSKDGYVIDGHHRWAAYVVNDSENNAFGDMTMPVVQVDMEIGQILDYTNWFADQQGIKPQSMDDRSSAAGKTAVKLSAASPVTDYWAEAYGWNPCCAPSSEEWRTAQLSNDLSADDLPETALDRVLRLSQVVVPPYTRRTATGQTQHVGGYTYERRGALGHGLGAKAGRFAMRTPTPTTRMPLGVQKVNGQLQMTKSAHNARLRQVKRLLNEARARGEETEQKYKIDTGKVDAHGYPIRAYTTERLKQHEQILTDLLDQAESRGVPHNRQAVMSGGLGGSGKSTTLARPESGINASQYVELNPDVMKEELIKRGMAPEVPGLQPMEASPLLHEESADLAKELASRAQKRGLNVMWDITMSSKKSVESRLNQLDANGYQTQAIFVSIPVETSVERALGRHSFGSAQYMANQGGLGGRFVDPDIIRSAKIDSPIYRSQNELVFDEVKDRFTNWKVFDTTGPNGPQLVSSKANHGISAFAMREASSPGGPLRAPAARSSFLAASKKHPPASKT